MKSVLASLVTVFGMSNGQMAGGWVIPGMGGGAASFTGVCNEPCMTQSNCPSACAVGTFNVGVSNMDCSATGACAQSTFNVNGGMNSIKFGAPNAAYGSTFNFQGGKIIAIECGSGFCGGVTFNVLGGDVSDLKCDEFPGCGAGCTFCQGGVCQPCDNVSTT